MKIHHWGRYLGDGLEFRHSLTYMAFGIRGSGKSTLLEHIAMEFLKNECPVLDLFGSRDGEGLGFLRSPWVTEKDMKVLLIHGDNTDVASGFDSKPTSKCTVEDIDHYDIIISASPLYSSIDVEYSQINRLVDEVYGRLVWERPLYLLIREAANLLYSRLKVSQDQTLAKAQLTYFTREARHCGFSLGLDTQKLSSIDIDIRVTLDYIFFKSLDIYGLPQDLRWLYKVYKPSALQRMPTNMFIMLTGMGSHGVGSFPYHEWHKRAGEDILKSVGVEVSHGEILVESKPSRVIGDLQHVRIVKMRVDGYNFREIAETEEISRGSSWAHIHAHNDEVAKKGECTKCKRAKSEYATIIIGEETPE